MSFKRRDLCFVENDTYPASLAGFFMSHHGNAATVKLPALLGAKRRSRFVVDPACGAGQRGMCGKEAVISDLL